MSKIHQHDANEPGGKQPAQRLTWLMVLGLSGVSAKIYIKMILSRYGLVYENRRKTRSGYVLAYINHSQTIPGYSLAYVNCKQPIYTRGTVWLRFAYAKPYPRYSLAWWNMFDCYTGKLLKGLIKTCECDFVESRG